MRWRTTFTPDGVPPPDGHGSSRAGQISARSGSKSPSERVVQKPAVRVHIGTAIFGATTARAKVKFQLLADYFELILEGRAGWQALSLLGVEFITRVAKSIFVGDQSAVRPPLLIALVIFCVVCRFSLICLSLTLLRSKLGPVRSL